MNPMRPPGSPVKRSSLPAASVNKDEKTESGARREKWHTLSLHSLFLPRTPPKITQGAIMATMRVVQVTRPHAPLEIVERPVPNPGPGWVRIKVQACGICHSDSLIKEGAWPGIEYPRVPGHEVAGVIDAVGSGVPGFAPGQHVGVGWHGGYCGHCDHCRRGEVFACGTRHGAGIRFDGGG